jgi:undecaprenyl-diphosphatase
MRTLLHRFDHLVTVAVLRWPRWIRPIMVTVTSLAHPVMVVSIAALLILSGLNGASILELSGWAILGTLVVGIILKLILRRKRPITYVVRRWFTTFSFPSGHTLGATAAYGLLAYLSCVFLSTPLAVLVSSLSVTLVILVGASRVYLGAHYPSDVIMGWAVGIIGVATVALSNLTLL